MNARIKGIIPKIFWMRVIDAKKLTGKYVFVENDGVQNGAYRIYGAK